MKAHGTVHKYGDNVDTDVIIPARSNGFDQRICSRSGIHYYHWDVYCC